LYDKRFLFEVEKGDQHIVHARVFLAVGSREGDGTHRMVPDLENMARILANHHALEVRHEVLEDETHDSVFPTAVSRGLRYVFRGD
jgi:predicted alpha/beta superfamily hydrolase